MFFFSRSLKRQALLTLVTYHLHWSRSQIIRYLKEQVLSSAPNHCLPSFKNKPSWESLSGNELDRSSRPCLSIYFIRISSKPKHMTSCRLSTCGNGFVKTWSCTIYMLAWLFCNVQVIQQSKARGKMDVGKLLIWVREPFKNVLAEFVR